MANEVINETEESKENESSAIEETNIETAAETPAEENVVEAAAEDAPVSKAPEAAAVDAPAEEPAVEAAATAETPASEAPEETAAEIPAAETTASQADEGDAGEEQQSSTDIDFGAILEKFEADQIIYHSGELVEGKVVGISDRGVLVDFGYKSEGAVPLEEFTSPEGEVTVKQGDQVEVVIRSIHTGDAPPILSRYDALRRKSWDEIEKAFNDEVPVIGRVMEKTKGGLRIDLNGVEAFLPGSQIDSRPIRNLDAYRGKEIEAKVIKFSRKRNNIVLSRKVLTDEVVNKQKAETLNAIEEGYVIEGTVKNLTEYGAFVDIGGIDGLLHVTDMSWGRLQNPGDQFKVNETVQVKVLKLDREKEKVSLGFKQLIPDPWQTVPELYPVGARITGKISSVTDYGAFIELEPGIEGLVHVSEMSWSKRAKSPRKMLHSGEEVEVQVLGIDSEDHRISLGMKQLQENPWDTIGDRYHVGDRIHGKVRNITDFGAFVEIEDGIDGLVHVSDISWSKKIKHPRDVLNRDQEVDAIITSIDRAGHRMSLSMKDIAPSEWETFVATHKPGDIIRGKVSRFAGFGIFVELGNELEGLCHISELSEDRVEKPEDVVQIGQEMDFKILRIEHDDQKIGLSARAVGREADTGGGGGGGVDSRSYSTEAKGGMASLGELANLKFGKASADEEPVVEEPKLSKKERKALKMQERAAAAEEAASADTASGDESEADSAVEANESVESVAGETSAETETAETVEEDSAAAASDEAAAEPAPETEVESAPAETSEETSETAEPTEAPAAEAESETPEVAAESAEAEETPVSTDAEAVDSETKETEIASSTDSEIEAESAPEITEAKDETAVAEGEAVNEAAGESGETDEGTEEKTASN